MGIAAALAATVFAMAAAPAFAQGLATVEPTLDECRSFVEGNGVPETRPVWENRGYSGWDVCLNMAYDGDLDGFFASADVNGDGKLGIAEQAAYMDSVIGPVSDPDQSPLTLDKCAGIISEYGVPAERPFVGWSNRGYSDVEVCQSLAFDGTLAASFAAADANADGRLDRAEQSSYIASLAAVATETPASGVAPATASPTSEAQYDSVVPGTESAAQSQYANAGAGNAGIEETIAPVAAEPTISAVSEDAATEESADPDASDELEKGVLSAVTDTVKGLLPETGGMPILVVLGGVALLAGGLVASRFHR